MRQNEYSGKIAVINGIIASICIVVYIAAIGIAAIRILLNINEYRGLASREFYELADRSSSAAFLGFMSQSYQDSLREALGDSKTLQGIIISGPRGDYAFERVRGTSIAWVGDRPLFKPVFGLSKEPLETPLWIDGQEGLTIRGVYDLVDYPFFVDTMKYALIMVGTALVLSFFTLISGALLKNSGRGGGNISRGRIPKGPPQEGGVYSPRSNLCREEFIQERLSRELQRCGPLNQDLALICLEFKDQGVNNDHIYRHLAAETIRFFTLRHLMFEKGRRGISIILPNRDLDQGMEKARELYARLQGSLPGAIELYMGISSRAERSVDAERLIFEASSALKKAAYDPASPIIAFKIDPEKYRAFIASQNKRHP